MWTVDLQLIEDWVRKQDDLTLAYLAAAIKQLEAEGPALGRPLVDSIKGSRLSNLKELRPASPGTSEVRVLFVFDPKRNAIMLIAGDKSKGSKKIKWSNWYKSAIKKAEERYQGYLDGLKDEADEEAYDR